MMLTDLHVHTTFSDGANTPEEVAEYAALSGVKVLGFSDHSYTSFDKSCCMKAEDYEGYKNKINALKEKYKNKLEIRLGIEQDYYSDMPANGFDYIIGSVHYVKAGDAYITIDDTPEKLLDAVNKHFNGDVYKLIDLYYSTLSDVVEKTDCDIIGHFDLVTKFNENGALFDENDPRYIASSRRAADRLLTYGVAFEINTGAISRGYRTFPYPSDALIKYLRERGGKFILSSDSHSAENICYMFDKFDSLIFNSRLKFI